MPQNSVRTAGFSVLGFLPFFALWTAVMMSSGQATWAMALASALTAMGSAGVLGIVVWSACERWPWPLGFRLWFYGLQIVLSIVYGVVWTAIVFALEAVIAPSANARLWSAGSWGRQALLGMWFYIVFAGLAYAVQTRRRLHEKEILTAHAEALAFEARLEALRARLNPHFLFNALHTLSAVVKFHPELAERAIEQLGDMLRYTLKDGAGLVDFADEYEFTRQYLAFEQLRFESRLSVNVSVQPESYEFAVPAFALQTLAENAVHHAIAIRPSGGTIWIGAECRDNHLHVSVRDDGPGGAAPMESHHLGLRSVRERLQAAFGSTAALNVERTSSGFHASFSVPSVSDPISSPDTRSAS